MIAWVADRPWAVFIPLAAALLCYRLNLLPAWGDEEITLDLARQPLPAVLDFLRRDIHPPLYHVVLHYWLMLPMPGDLLTRARMLSVVALLLALVAFDRCWLRQLDRQTRWWFAALWSLSPCLFLYGRMARNYTLQVLIACVAIRAAYDLIRQPTDRRRMVLYAVAATLLLYTHYLSGIAVIAGTLVILVIHMLRARDIEPLPAIAPLVLIAIAYAPWLGTLTSSLRTVSYQSPYTLLTHPVAEQLLRLGYTLVSFSFGETISSAGIAIGALVAPAVVFLVLWSTRQPPGWLPLALTVAAIAYVGAARRVSFAFMPARLLFLYPFFLLLLVDGGRRASRWGIVALTGLLVTSLVGIGAYLGGAGFLNKGYLIPLDRIAALIEEHSGDAEVVVAIDHFGTNATALTRRLPPRCHVIVLDSPARIDDVLAEEVGRPIWLVRNTHDVSPGGIVEALDAKLMRRGSPERHYFVPYSDLDHRVMRLAGWAALPSHMVVVVEPRRANTPR